MPALSKAEQAAPVVTFTFGPEESYTLNVVTGELVAWKGEADVHMDELLALAFRARHAGDNWTTMADGLGQVIRHRMRDADVKKVSGSAGSAMRVPYKGERVPGGPAFVQWLKDSRALDYPGIESIANPDEAIAAVLSVLGGVLRLLDFAQAFGVEAFREWAAERGIAADMAERAVTKEPFEQLRFEEAKEPPPDVTRAAAAETDHIP